MHKAHHTVVRPEHDRKAKTGAAHPGGGSSGGIFTAGSPLAEAGRSMSARLKFLPHAPHARRARHLLTSTYIGERSKPPVRVKAPRQTLAQ